MRKGLHGSAHVERYLVYAIGEILLVMIGILLALQVNNWNEDRKNTKAGLNYLFSLCEDLKLDSIQIAFLIDDYREKVDQLEQMDKCYDSVMANAGDHCLVAVISASSYFFNLRNIDRTLQQLEYEGGSQLLPSEDWNKILAYDIRISEYKIAETTVFQETQTSLRFVMNEVLNYKAFQSTDTLGSEPLIVGDDFILNKYFNTLKLYRDYCQINLISLADIRILNSELREYFLEKYQFE